MTTNRYTAGTSVNLTVTFTQVSDSSAVDPDTVTLYVRRTDGTVETFVYGVDSEISKSSTGVYTLLYLIPLASKPGTFVYGAQGSGTYNVASSNGRFIVVDWEFA